MIDRYRKVKDLPDIIPVFPLSGTILLPRCSLPLKIFEPRYLEMIDAVLAGDRIIGMVQPVPERGCSSKYDEKDVILHSIGCAGRLTRFSENEDGSLYIGLTGICRFELGLEVDKEKEFRSFSIMRDRFSQDLQVGVGEEGADRDLLLSVLKEYLVQNDLSTDWDSIEKASTEHLVNTLSVLSPYGCEEKQALLEAESLKNRADILIALAQMDLASGNISDSGGGVLQ